MICFLNSFTVEEKQSQWNREIMLSIKIFSSALKKYHSNIVNNVVFRKWKKIQFYCHHMLIIVSKNTFEYLKLKNILILKFSECISNKLG